MSSHSHSKAISPRNHKALKLPKPLPTTMAANLNQEVAITLEDIYDVACRVYLVGPYEDKPTRLYLEHYVNQEVAITLEIREYGYNVLVDTHRCGIHNYFD